MRRDEHIRQLMTSLRRAIEVSLAATEATREALAELLKRGSGAGTFFRTDRSGPSLDLTHEDREFLRALGIRPEDR
ncbi:MAG: hypothetical protein ACE5JD_03875 [Candidatus Methylomirabilia bacterium]